MMQNADRYPANTPAMKALLEAADNADGEEACPGCGSTNFQSYWGFLVEQYGQCREEEILRCVSCGEKFVEPERRLYLRETLDMYWRCNPDAFDPATVHFLHIDALVQHAEFLHEELLAARAEIEELKALGRAT